MGFGIRQMALNTGPVFTWLVGLGQVSYGFFMCFLIDKLGAITVPVS